jgi:uncharacterized Ntn-hydrolase superfamily protein
MTFSIAACCAFARAGIGAVATQNVTDPTLGPRALDLMALGATAMQALEVIRGSAPHIAYRQLAIIDAQGRTASFSGERTLGVHATTHGPDVVCAGNLLARENVPAAMAAAFSAAAGHPGRPAPGGHAGSGGRRWRGGAGALGRHAAGARCRWPVADLRVDWAEADPIGGLERLWEIYRRSPTPASPERSTRARRRATACRETSSG